MGDRLVSFPKLNSSNYDNWSFQMKLLLTKEGNWTAVADPEPEPVTDAWKRWRQSDWPWKAKSAAEAWEALEKFHVKKTLPTKVSVMRKICSLRLEKHGYMEAHVSKLTELFEKLNNLQQEKILDDQ